MRRPVLLLTLLLLLVVAAPAARADTVTVNCAGLPTALSGATAGRTIVLSETCTGHSYTLPSVPITLTASAPGIGFNGGDPDTPILAGANVGATTISGLTFTNGNVVTGSRAGAINITGNSAPRIVGSRFFSNIGTSAGAVSIAAALAGGTTTVQGSTFGSATPGQGNTGKVGGGLSLGVSTGDAVISGNDVTGNRATNGLGGGLYVATLSTGSLEVTGNRIDANSVIAASGDQDGGGMFLFDVGATITISQNQFIENTIGATTGNRHGGGLEVVAGGAAQTRVTQVGNGFDENSIAAGASGETGGAGEWIAGARVDSTRDSFTSNAISSPGGEGAGVGVEGLMHGSTLLAGELHAADLVADGNRLAPGGRGAGIYAGGPHTCTIADCPSVLELNDSTVAGNCIEAGPGAPAAPGIAGSGDDTLALRNSIVYDHQPTLACGTPAALADVAGFAAARVSVASSDLCDAAAASGPPAAGAGNICADPLLANPHFGGSLETAASPTIDVGSNAAVPAGMALDASGGPRITDGNGDGSAVVDMGAAESPAQPPVLDKTPPKLVIVSRTVRESARWLVHIRVKCIDQSHCGGTLALTTKSRGKTLKAGSGRFNIPSGATHTVFVRLAPKVRSLLRRLPRIRVRAKATARDLAGNVGHASKTLTVKAAKKKRH
ncbi:MAG: hypothetical protein JWN32_313 [Solirubrobacterales bacterium]|nr:hypothetical protein [Solirubrobacterales bacterium]